jgi:tetrathionate reductase subunit B
MEIAMRDTSGEKRALTRRDVLKGAATGAVAAAAAGVAAPDEAKSIEPGIPDPLPTYGMVIDTRLCIGCHACSVACKSEFDVPLGETRSWVEYVEKGNYPNVSRSFLPRLCNHCRHPQCVDVCPTGATWKRDEDGIVVIDEGICIGCKYCMQACPYDARFLNPINGIVEKCSFCIHRVSKGMVPACVETCVGGARVFGDITDPESEVFKLIEKNPTTVLRPEKGTEPNVFYIAADHTDEHTKLRGRYVSVTTHRRQKERM